MQSFIRIIYLLILAFLYVNFDAYAQGEEVKSLRLCRSNLLPLDLNKELGIAFAPGLGNWYNSEGQIISNVFIFPKDVLVNQEFKFTYKLTNFSSTCVDKGDQLYDVILSIGDLEPPSGKSTQIFCFVPELMPLVSDLIVNGDNVKWYISADALEPLDVNTPLINNETYYASSTLIGCGESMDRFPVSVVMGLTPDISPKDDIVKSHLQLDLNQLIDRFDDKNNTDGVWSFYNTYPDTINDISLIVDRIIDKSGLIYAMKSTDIGCYDVDSIDVLVENLLKIPRGFSPNNDGMNDKFVIEGLDNYPVNELVIANRHGNVVYKAKNYQNDWDGIPNTGVLIGKGILPDATYFLVLKLPDSNIVIKDYVYIKR